MSQSFRLPEGGVIDRSRRLGFRFDGRTFTGHPGDTLASALLANGVHLIGRSFKYHRPRGILSAGAEEPNALIQLGEGAYTEPNLRATQIELFEGLRARSQNRWPSLDWDVGAINNAMSRLFPAGFYYKTFMWPAALWMKYEYVIRHAAGLGEAPKARDPDSYDKTFAHCDVLVVGGGPAGLAAALAAGATGARVILAEQDSDLGGSLLSDAGATIDGQPALDWVAAARRDLEAMPEVTILTRTLAYGYFDHNFIALNQRLTDHLSDKPAHTPRQRLWKLRAKQVVLATGAIERPLVFPDNDRPGIMLASACRSYLNRFAVRPGSKAVVVTNNESGYQSALDMAAAGMQVAAVVDLRDGETGTLSDRANDAGLRVIAGSAVIATEGKPRLRSVRVARLNESGTQALAAGESIDCDLLAMSGGWNPSLHLFSQSRGKVRFDAELGCFVPGAPAQAARNAGACNGAFGLGECLEQGHAAGQDAAKDAGAKGGRKRGAAPRAENQGILPARWTWEVPSDKPQGRAGKAFVDFQNDVTANDLRLAVREGYRSIEHIKRYTTTGMGTDQGKTSNVNAIGIAAAAMGRDLPELGVTTFRPPYTPVTFGIFAGRDVDDLLDPVRKTAIHVWHEQAGAVFEDVGQWKRPWYFPKHGESMHEAVNREVKAARASIGIMDGSTLGKIDIQGRDAAEFLNRVYTNAWLQLGIGRCRYGLMLNEAGMVIDDGVTSRLGEEHYLMTTTTGNAAPVLHHLEEYLQTEWPDLQVYLTSVTEQYATVTIAGPNARALLAELAEKVDLSTEALPHMAIAEGQVAGIPARIARISFTGEVSYEINVPSSCGLALWQALMNAGAKYEITPYGTEAMHVLRAEKGFIIVGQETDGSVTPLDLGMDWIASKKKKDFIGKRSLSRPDMLKPDRKQLVGLLTEDPKEVLPDGAQLVERVLPKPPMAMVGHVSSSYFSPNLGRSIALALIKGGRERMGQTLHAPLASGATIACKVTGPVFLDPEGNRLND
jgi:sarcosine oxidase subunit alpha